MPQGKGKTSSRRRSSDGHPYGDRPRLPRDSFSFSDTPHAASAPSSYLDTSIPFNLPPRRSMKMLKDGSDFVWPDAAHSLFVRGLQAWKFLNIGSKRTRAPRGEGKTDFLVRYLQSHGVERTKKQVASHLQVLRTEWRNLDNTLLLSLVDETVSHTRSLSEPTLPPSASSSTSSPSTSLSVFNTSPDPSEDRAISTPALPSPIPTVSPPSSSSLFHPAHNIYSTRPHDFPVTMSDNPARIQPSTNLGSWQLDNTVWNTAVERFPAQQTESFSRPQSHYSLASYDPPTSFHEYETSPGPSTQESRGFTSDYYGVPGLSSLGEPSSSVAPLPRGSHSLTPLALEVDTSATTAPSPTTYVPPPPYNSYNNPSSYSIPQQPTPHDAYGHASMSYGTEPYQTHFSPGEQQHTNPTHAMELTGSASYDVVEPDFLPNVQHVQPRWVRPPASFPRAPDTPERRDRSPKL